MSVDWDSTCTGMDLRVFDDGHVPETLENVATRLAEYPLFRRHQTTQVHVFADALPETLVDAAYGKTAGCGQPAWGDYVTIQEITDYWEHSTSHDLPKPGSSDNLAIALAAHFILLSLGEERKPSKLLDSSGICTPHQLWTRKDMHEQAHGVAVWGLAAHVQSQVPYHLDYAEQIRYESNVIVPPLMAGTLQCTRDKMKGGEFVVSLQGIPHYQKHGYKCKRQQLSFEEMSYVPYQFNQLTCHLGNLPHASTKVEHIDGNQLRVIIGFNVFGHHVGPTVQRAPEHSEQFRRQIQAQRVLLRNNKNVLSLEQLKQNKPLAKLLVLAKREQIKKQFREAQRRLIDEISNHVPATVQELMDQYYDENSDLCWPTSKVDVQVFIHHEIQQGRLITIPSTNNARTLISVEALVDLPRREEETHTYSDHTF